MKIAHNRVIASAFYTKNSHYFTPSFLRYEKAAIHKRIVAAVRVCLYLFLASVGAFWHWWFIKQIPFLRKW